MNWIQRFLAAIVTHKDAPDAHVAELLPTLLKGANTLHIPTNAGWTTSHTESGGGEQLPTYQSVWTGMTANSRGQLEARLSGFGAGVGSYTEVSWDNKLYFIFNYNRSSSDTEVVARVQMKEVNSEGALTAKGIGIRADNLSLVGESYGTELGEVDLGVTLTSGIDQQILIIHDPSVPKIEWYVDGVLKGTQSTAAKIPSGVAGATSRLLHTIINGATGGVWAISAMFHPKLWQAR